MKKKNTVKQTDYVDSQTGEVVGTELKKISYEQEPDYVKLYVGDIFRLYGLTATQNGIVYALLRKMNYDSEVVFTTSIRKEMVEELRISGSTFKNTLGALQDLGLLMRIENNRYKLNPHIFARGQWQDIKKIQLTITYDKNGRMIQTLFDTQTSMQFENDDK